MTRAWGGHTRSALGVKAHTDHLARGPSKSWTVAQVLKTASANWIFSLDARLAIGIQTLGTRDYTGGICFIDIGSCGSPPTVDYSHTETGVRSWTIDTPYLDSFPDLIDTEPETTESGKWTYKDETGTPRCYGFYRNPSNAEFGFNLRIPSDMNDTVRYFAATVNGALEADRTTGVPACASGWTVSPPAGLVYRPSSVSGAACYQVFRRDAEGGAWTSVDAPRERWPNAAVYGAYRLCQHTGTIWAKTAANELKVWPIETGYLDATPTTITLPAGNVSWFVTWENTTFVGATDGNIYVYIGTSYYGAFGAPLNTATWDYAFIAHGWLALTQDGTLHFWKIDPATGIPMFFQTIEGSADTVSAYVSVELAGPDHAISGTYHRILFDHAAGSWEYGGQMSHVRALADDGWAWGGTQHRHQFLYRETVGDSSRWDYRYAQVF